MIPLLFLFLKFKKPVGSCPQGVGNIRKQSERKCIYTVDRSFFCRKSQFLPYYSTDLKLYQVKINEKIRKIIVIIKNIIINIINIIIMILFPFEIKKINKKDQKKNKIS